MSNTTGKGVEERIQAHLDNIKKMQKEYAEKFPTANTIHVNQIKFTGDDDWANQFNKCSDLFCIAMDDSKTEQEKESAWKEYISERQALELGYFTHQPKTKQ